MQSTSSAPEKPVPIPPGIPPAALQKQNGIAATVAENMHQLLPHYQGAISDILPPPPKVAKQEDDLLLHQHRIDAIDDALVLVSDAIQKVFYAVGEGVKQITPESAGAKKWPVLEPLFSTLIQRIDAARSHAARGQFAMANESCALAWDEFQHAYAALKKELLGCFDPAIFDKKVLAGLFTQSKEAMRISVETAQSLCKECVSFIAELGKAANKEVPAVDKAAVKAAFSALTESRIALQKIIEGTSPGDKAAAKAKVKEALSKCRDLCWLSANAILAKKQHVEKAKLAASLIPKATAAKIIALATKEQGTPEKPSTVTLEGHQFEVAHGLSLQEHQVIRLPKEEEVLGKGAWNVVIRVSNTSSRCFQALRKRLTPPGAPPPDEKRIMRSCEIYKNIGPLKGTTTGPEAAIRKGTGGLLTSIYSDDVIKWMQMIPPPELRWQAFKMTLDSFIEFAKGGNVHGDIHPGNLSMMYDTKKSAKKEGSPVAVPSTLKIEDLDGACHIIEGYDANKAPIYSKKGAEVGIVCKFATQAEVDRWIAALAAKDLKGIADVRFGQDILATGITLYQMLTLDFDLDNLYLNKKCAPFTDKDGQIIPGKFEEGIFVSGQVNVEYIRGALDEYPFLSATQKEKVLEFLVKATTLSTQDRAKLPDLEAALAV